MERFELSTALTSLLPHQIHSCPESFSLFGDSNPTKQGGIVIEGFGRRMSWNRHNLMDILEFKTEY